MINVVPQSIQEEEIPAIKPLLVDGHLTKPAPGAGANEQPGWHFGFDQHRRAHDNPASEISADQPKVPVLGDLETRMMSEAFEDEVPLPEGDGAVGKRRTTPGRREFALHARQFVFQVLELLDHRAFGAVGAGGFDGVAHALDQASLRPGLNPGRDDRERRGEQAVVVDHEHVLELVGCIGAHELGHNLGAYGHPDVVDFVRPNDLFGIVERSGTVSVRNHIDVFGREDLECRLDRRPNHLSRLVARND